MFNPITISRPTLTIIASPSGKRFAIEATADTWSNVYQSLLPVLKTEKDAKAFIEDFASDFEEDAAVIEDLVATTGNGRRNIMRDLVDHGMWRSRRKLVGAMAKRYL
tara:strand:- start:129 stop:449 length:321 start_codon:yes stop_codon:yes gene_type:complete